MKLLFIRIRLFFVTLFHRFIYSAKEYKLLDRSMNGWMTKYQAAVERIQTLENQIHELKEESVRLKTDFDKRGDRINELMGQIDRFDNYKRVDAEYLRAVQEQLATEFAGHPNFGFPRSLGLPGSVSMETHIADEMEGCDGVIRHYAYNRGRIILDDQVTKQINETAHMYDKLTLILRHMDRYGTLSKIMWDLIMNGSMCFTLTYRPETTTYQMFYEIAAKMYSRESILTFDSKTGCMMEAEQYKTEEG